MGLDLCSSEPVDVRHQGHMDEAGSFPGPPPGDTWRMASRNGWLSMSPVVPPISVMTTSASVFLPTIVDEALDLVGDVGDDLHRLAQIFALALLVQHVPVDLAGGQVGVLVQVLVDEALVVAQIQVGLGAVVGDEDLAVLVGAHGAGVDVDIRVQLLGRDLQPAGS